MHSPEVRSTPKTDQNPSTCDDRTIQSKRAPSSRRLTPVSFADETLVRTTPTFKLTRCAIPVAISKGRVRSRVRRDSRGGVVPGAAAMSESKPVGRTPPGIGVTEPSTAPDRSVTGSRGLWTMSETAEWLNVPERMVRRLVAERRIPFVKVGRYVRFRPEDVEGWRDGNVRPTMVVTRQTLTG
jgi:excisionase family DNA binding protein